MLKKKEKKRPSYLWYLWDNMAQKIEITSKRCVNLFIFYFFSINANDDVTTFHLKLMFSHMCSHSAVWNQLLESLECCWSVANEDLLVERCAQLHLLEKSEHNKVCFFLLPLTTPGHKIVSQEHWKWKIKAACLSRSWPCEFGGDLRVSISETQMLGIAGQFWKFSKISGCLSGACLASCGAAVLWAFPCPQNSQQSQLASNPAKLADELLLHLGEPRVWEAHDQPTYE
jgi:hypothetical protein